MLKIGISSCFEYPNADRPVFGPKTLSYVESDMMRYLARQDVLPILIPDIEEELQHKILEQVDGFLFQGGTDLAPETYGEKPIGRWKGDAYRDRYELKILDYAISRNKPILGICRGFQLMNVYFGGSLYQDIETQLPDANNHRSAELYDKVSHPIIFEPNLLLDKLYKDESHPQVNSVHHQAVKELGQNLEVYARSEDGLIEAFGYTKAPEGHIFGVQWHPEFFHTLEEKLIDADKIIDTFLSHCKNENH